MRVFLCWPAGTLKAPPPCDSFDIEDADGRPWNCTPMRLEGGEPFEIDDGINLAQMAVEGGADFVLVNARDRSELPEMLAHGIRFVGFPVPVREEVMEMALCPMPSDN